MQGNFSQGVLFVLCHHILCLLTLYSIFMSPISSLPPVLFHCRLCYFTVPCTISLSPVLFHCSLCYFTVPCAISLSPVLFHYPLYHFTVPCIISLSPVPFHCPRYYFTISNSHSLQVCHEMLGQEAHQASTWRGFSI